MHKGQCELYSRVYTTIHAYVYNVEVQMYPHLLLLKPMDSFGNGKNEINFFVNAEFYRVIYLATANEKVLHCGKSLAKHMTKFGDDGHEEEIELYKLLLPY